MQKYKLNIVDPKAKRYFFTLGIPEDRAMKLIQDAENAVIQSHNVTDSMERAIQDAQSIEELVFTIFKLGEFHGFVTAAQQPQDAINSGARFLMEAQRFSRKPKKDGLSDSKPN